MRRPDTDWVTARLPQDTGLEGWWFRDGDIVGRFIRFISAGETSGFVVTLQHPETKHLGEISMVPVKAIWENAWQLFPPTSDGSCPVPEEG